MLAKRTASLNNKARKLSLGAGATVRIRSARINPLNDEKHQPPAHLTRGVNVRIAYGLGVLGIAVGLTTGCSTGGGTEAATSTAAPMSAPAPSTGDVAVPTQLDFAAKTVNGEEFSGESLAGKAAVLWFWTPWCPTCQGEAPEVAKVARDNPDVAFLGVSAQAEVPAMKDFVDKYGTGFFTNIADVDGSVWQRFGVTAQPAFAFIGRDGSVDVVRGPLPESDLAGQVAKLAS